MFAGNAIGAFMVGRLSDIFGRKLPMMLSLVGCLVTVVIMMVDSNLNRLFFVIFLFGIFNGVRAVSSYTLAVEMVSPNLRKTISVVTNMSICCGIMYSTLIFYFFRHYYALFGSLTVILIIYCFVLMIIPESPEFLYNQRRFDDLRSAFNTIATINSKEKLTVKFDREVGDFNQLSNLLTPSKPIEFESPNKRERRLRGQDVCTEMA